MSVKRLQRIVENAAPRKKGSKAAEPKHLVEARVLIRDGQRVVGIEVFRDGKMQFIPGVSTHISEDDSGYRSLDDLAQDLIDELAAQAISEAIEYPEPPAKRKRLR